MGILRKTSLLLVGTCFIAGLGYYAWQRGWLVIHWATHQLLQKTPIPSAEKKMVTLYAWHAGAWKKERTELILATEPARRAHSIIQALLSWLTDEHWLTKKITVERVIPCADQELLVELNKSLFSKTMSTHHKIMLVESIAKTVRENDIGMPIRLLVDHEPMSDQHLDFTDCWPAQGYSNY